MIDVRGLVGARVSCGHIEGARVVGCVSQPNGPGFIDSLMLIVVDGNGQVDLVKVDHENQITVGEESPAAVLMDTIGSILPGLVALAHVGLTIAGEKLKADKSPHAGDVGRALDAIRIGLDKATIGFYRDGRTRSAHRS